MCPNDYSARLVFVKVASNCLLSRSWNIWTICQGVISKMDEGWRRPKLRLTKVSRCNCVINGQTAPTCYGFVGFVFKQNLIAANFLICFWWTVALLNRLGTLAAGWFTKVATWLQCLSHPIKPYTSWSPNSTYLYLDFHLLTYTQLMSDI